MTLFILGLIIFFGAHLFTASARGAREALIGRLGAGPYKGLYSLVSIAGFVLIIMGWPKADGTVLFVSPYWMIHVVYLLMLVSLALLASAYLPKGRIAPAVKHPMLASVKIWAFAHLLVNGDVRSLITHPATTTHSSMPPDQRRAAGISDGLLRLSIGIEDVEDLWRDLDRALG